MAFALLFIGILLTVSSVRGTHAQLFQLVHDDFTGQGNFVFWAVIVVAIGSIGYIKPLAPISRAFLILIVIVLLLKRGNPNGIGGGFFQQLLSQVNTTKTATPSSVAAGGNSTSNSLPTLPSLGDVFGGIFGQGVN